MENVNREAPLLAQIDRRLFLSGSALAAVPLIGAAFAQERFAQPPRQQNEPSRNRLFPGMIARQRHPDNLEFPFSMLESFLTPNEQFYVRNHFPVPQLNAKTWRLRIEGSVNKPFEIGYDELRKMTGRTQTALLECSGNSRVLLRPPQLGIRWEQGAVSNAEWTGVPLAELLDRAGVRKNAAEVILEGADRGEYREPNPKTPGVIHYARSLSLAKARRPEVLLAYRMNGRDLPPAHGFPVRAVVPGWYGMASVKWLKRIIVTDRPFHGYFQTFMYTIWERRNELPDLVPVTELQIKAQIARPMLHEVVPTASKYRIFGAAWAGGEAEVAQVDVSTDGGQHWSAARLLQKPVRYAWRFWEYEWTTPRQPGPCTLMARATDSQKRVQPMERDDDRRDAVVSHVQPITVEVR
jgi:DMSO/TMAO reductase YedYZ molybdopterin-dependent catalytic subunit